MSAATSSFPDINPQIKFVGVSKLRDLNASKLREQTDDALVIQENDTPLSVLLSYARYQAMREEFNAMLSMIEMLANDNERNGLLKAFEELRAGRVRSLDDIEADLEKE
jgi:PHD/YefM family antitoxin component YafN of YafNO toxin-antitoxin module